MQIVPKWQCHNGQLVLCVDYGCKCEGGLPLPVPDPCSTSNIPVDWCYPENILITLSGCDKFGPGGMASVKFRRQVSANYNTGLWLPDSINDMPLCNDGTWDQAQWGCGELVLQPACSAEMQWTPKLISSQCNPFMQIWQICSIDYEWCECCNNNDFTPEQTEFPYCFTVTITESPD